jgi:hypothetical protein
MSSLFSVLSSHVFLLDVKLVPTVVVSTVLSNLGPLYCVASSVSFRWLEMVLLLGAVFVLCFF